MTSIIKELKNYALNTLHKLEDPESEKIIKMELFEIEKILNKYMKHEDVMNLSFHILNIMRELNNN